MINQVIIKIINRSDDGENSTNPTLSLSSEDVEHKKHKKKVFLSPLRKNDRWKK